MKHDTHFPSMSFELSDFMLSTPRLDSARRQLERTYACGAILMLEKTFQDYPLLARLDFSSDYEGWHSSYPMLRRPSGALAWTNDVMMALCRLDELALAGTPYDPLEHAEQNDYCNPALGLEFHGLDHELVRDMEASASDGLAFFHRFSPDLFSDCMDRTSERKTSVEPADAQGIATQLGLGDLAAYFERARLEAHAAQGASAKPAPSL